MLCHQCGARMDTVDSRPTIYRTQPSVRRRRRCTRCGWMVSTFEVTAEALITAEARLNAALPHLTRVFNMIGVVLAEVEQINEVPGGAVDTPPVTEQSRPLGPVPAGE